ncbi:MAG TPA: hypothetical protein VGR09_10960 [Gemmatimonadales bacterium]|nr:hypothetical protein [Gemmatimonadales bacterium]
MPARRGIAFGALAVLLLAARSPGPVPTAFWFDRDARPLLHQLWQSSLAAKAERVACLAATIEGDTVRISDVLPLDPARSDSLGIAASTSLETCGPSRWRGTVHTHVALRDGLRPYSLFSGADRGVMMLWWQRWQVAGIFCLLYSENDVICEIEGPEGAVLFPRSHY